MLIQLNERHLSAYAQRRHIEPMIATLQALGWPVEYSAGPCLWDFDSIKAMWQFEKDFERARETAEGPCYVWRTRFPCDCQEGTCDCGIWEEPVAETRFFDYEK